MSELNAEVRTLLEQEYADVAVAGEVSNLKRHSSGHVYFTLKDARAQIKAVCFRRDAEQLDVDLEDGMEIVANGRVTVYEAWGNYQIVVYGVERIGHGQLEIEFRKLKERLEKEGLFDAAHKQPLPRFPLKAVVITSPTGAAVRDIISTCRRRWPPLEILVYPVHVQGRQAAPEIVRAIERAADVPDVDVVIAGRGGGSLEDLWAFNEESVARAIYECPIPVVSAVGHETDFTIADFVADHRAATPTMAAEIVTPRIEEVMGAIDRRVARIAQQARMQLSFGRSRLQELLRSYALGRVRSRIEQSLQGTDYAIERLIARTRQLVGDRRSRIDALSTRLNDLDASAILRRGYTICSDEASGRIMRSAEPASTVDTLRITFHDGAVLSRVKEAVDGHGKN